MRARHHRGYMGGRWPVEGGVRRSAVVFFVARRGVSTETRGKHEGPHCCCCCNESSMYVRNYKDFLVCNKRTFKPSSSGALFVEKLFIYLLLIYYEYCCMHLQVACTFVGSLCVCVFFCVVLLSPYTGMILDLPQNICHIPVLLHHNTAVDGYCCTFSCVQQ